MKKLTKTILSMEEEVSEPIVMLENESIIFQDTINISRNYLKTGRRKEKKNFSQNFCIIEVDQTNVL